MEGEDLAGKPVDFAAINYGHVWDENQRGRESLGYAARAMANL
jgi:hypothetical protein